MLFIDLNLEFFEIMIDQLLMPQLRFNVPLLFLSCQRWRLVLDGLVAHLPHECSQFRIRSRSQLLFEFNLLVINSQSLQKRMRLFCFLIFFAFNSHRCTFILLPLRAFLLNNSIRLVRHDSRLTLAKSLVAVLIHCRCLAIKHRILAHLLIRTTISIVLLFIFNLLWWPVK